LIEKGEFAFKELLGDARLVTYLSIKEASLLSLNLFEFGNVSLTIFISDYAKRE